MTNLTVNYNNQDLYSRYSTWQEKSDLNQIEYYDEVIAFGPNITAAQSEEALNKYLEREARIGIEFDFMEGKDFNDETAYNEQTLKLAKGKVQDQDRNDDSLVTLSEFLIDEITPETIDLKSKIKSGEITEEEALLEAEALIRNGVNIFNIIDAAMGDGNGTISTDEYQSWFQYLDLWSGVPGAPEKNGKFDALDESEYTSFLLEQIGQNESTEKLAQIYAPIFLGLNN